MYVLIVYTHTPHGVCIYIYIYICGVCVCVCGVYVCYDSGICVCAKIN